MAARMAARMATCTEHNVCLMCSLSHVRVRGVPACALQERGVDTLDANLELGLPVDSREYGTGAQILADLGITDMRLVSNNPKKFTGLAGYGLRIVERVPSHTAPNPENIRYLQTKLERMGHLLGPEIGPAQEEAEEGGDPPAAGADAEGGGQRPGADESS